MERKRKILECCTDSVESAVLAEKGGADRLELCSNLIIGGTSPGFALFEMVKERIKIPIYVLLRPRFGDFLYTENEYAIICREAEWFKKAGADGIVIGCLQKDGNLDLERMRELVSLAGGMHITLHRAFDMTPDGLVAASQAKELGIQTILTSGQKNSAWEGREYLRMLWENFGEEIEIMAGAGIDAGCINRLLEERIDLPAFHMSGKEKTDSKMEYRREGISMGLPFFSEYQNWRTGRENVEAVRKILDNKR